MQWWLQWPRHDFAFVLRMRQQWSNVSSTWLFLSWIKFEKKSRHFYDGKHYFFSCFNPPYANSSEVSLRHLSRSLWEHWALFRGVYWLKPRRLRALSMSLSVLDRPVWSPGLSMSRTFIPPLELTELPVLVTGGGVCNGGYGEPCGDEEWRPS